MLGNACGAAGDLVIGHDDAVDAAAVRRALASAGSGELMKIFAKAEASATGRDIGRRHTMTHATRGRWRRLRGCHTGAGIKGITM